MTQASSTNLQGLVIAGLLICCAGAIVVAHGFKSPSDPARSFVQLGKASTVLEQPLALPDFELTDHRGGTFGRASFSHHWSWLTFGYTSCPDVCPTTLALLNRAHSLVGAKDLVPPSVFLVTVDPDRDSVEALAEYMPFFNHEFTGATGPMTEIGKLTGVVGVHHLPDGPTEINHTSSVFLVNPAGEIRALSSPPFAADELADDFASITGTYR